MRTTYLTTSVAVMPKTKMNTTLDLLGQAKIVTLVARITMWTNMKSRLRLQARVRAKMASTTLPLMLSVTGSLTSRSVCAYITRHIARSAPVVDVPVQRRSVGLGIAAALGLDASSHALDFPTAVDAYLRFLAAALLLPDGGESVVRRLPASPDAILWDAARSRVEVSRCGLECSTSQSRFLPPSCSETSCSAATALLPPAPGSPQCASPSTSCPAAGGARASRRVRCKAGRRQTP